VLLTRLDLFFERVIVCVRLLVEVVWGCVHVGCVLEFILLVLNLLVAREDLPGVPSDFLAPRDAQLLRGALILRLAFLDKLPSLV